MGVLKQIRLRESQSISQGGGCGGGGGSSGGGPGSLLLGGVAAVGARALLHRLCRGDATRAKSCENLHVL